MTWLLGTKKYYNLDIDYIGIWNERPWDVCDDVSKDPEWTAAIDVIGAHYPATGIKASCPILNKVQ
jgi:galactosylceramidase